MKKRKGGKIVNIEYVLILYRNNIGKDMKILGIQIRKTRDIIGFSNEKANVYYDKIGVGISESLF